MEAFCAARATHIGTNYQQRCSALQVAAAAAFQITCDKLTRALHICECEAAAAAVGAILRLSVLQTHLLQSGGQPKDLRQ
jgi:hypothetical protein